MDKLQTGDGEKNNANINMLEALHNKAKARDTHSYRDAKKKSVRVQKKQRLLGGLQQMSPVLLCYSPCLHMGDNIGPLSLFPSASANVLRSWAKDCWGSELA